MHFIKVIQPSFSFVKFASSKQFKHCIPLIDIIVACIRELISAGNE